MNIPKLNTFVLKSIIAELVTPTGHHANNIRELYRMIHEACRNEFGEDNDPTLDGFLFELFKETQAQPEVFISLYDKPEDYVRPNNFTRYSSDSRGGSCDEGEYVLWQDFRQLELRFIALSQYHDRLHKQRVTKRSGRTDIYASPRRNKDLDLYVLSVSEEDNYVVCLVRDNGVSLGEYEYPLDLFPQGLCYGMRCVAATDRIYSEPATVTAIKACWMESYDTPESREAEALLKSFDTYVKDTVTVYGEVEEEVFEQQSTEDFKAQCIDETAAFDEAAFENLTPENRAAYDRAKFIKTPLHLKFEYLYDTIQAIHKGFISVSNHTIELDKRTAGQVELGSCLDDFSGGSQLSGKEFADLVGKK